jgi:hypothetical protein
MGGLMSITNIRVQLNDLEMWMERLQDLGVVEVGQHVAMPLDIMSAGIEELTEYYRGLVEKAEKERIE